MSPAEAGAAVEAARAAHASASDAEAKARDALAAASTLTQQAKRALIEAQAALFEAGLRALPPPDGAIHVVAVGHGPWALGVSVEKIVSDSIFEGRATLPFRAERPDLAPMWGQSHRFSTAAGYSRRDLMAWIAAARRAKGGT